MAIILNILILGLLSLGLAYLYDQIKGLGKKVLVYIIASVLIVLGSYLLRAYLPIDAAQTSAMLIIMPAMILLHRRIFREIK